ncbi:MAG: MaoC/PaaZ C-terminal domain-containing protein [bacterium]
MSTPLNTAPVGQPLQPATWSYGPRDCALYALGVGETDLRYTWEGHARFAVLPGFAVVPTMAVVMQALAAVGADYRTLVHGEQSLRLHAPIPRKGELTTTAVIREIQDKGRGAVVLIDTETRIDDTLLFETTWSIFCRGQGGFGGPRGEAELLPAAVEGAAPAFDETYHIPAHQALIYRLSGDLNPLHVDPALAKAVGFERPILHGLCTFGYALRAAIQHLAGGEPSRVTRFQARFAGVVYPGESVSVVCVPAKGPRGTTWLFEARVGDRLTLSHGLVEVIPSDAAA